MNETASQPPLTSEGTIGGAASAIAAPVRPAAQGLAAVLELTKPRITRLVTITSGVGFVLGAIGLPWTWQDLLWRGLACTIGTGLAASGANALNQWWERERDARMPRTCARPLPTQRVAPETALIWGIALAILGTAILALVGWIPALLTLATVLIYVLIYTPLKPVTTFNTLVGAIPGALPPLIGWVAASSPRVPFEDARAIESLMQPGGWLLFAIMLVWQVPHVLALAWMYKDDYAKGGYRMLPITDPDGRLTANTMVVWGAALIPISVAPAFMLYPTLGAVSGVIALLSGIGFFVLCLKVRRTRERADARRVFLASIAHLPLLLAVYVGDALVRLVM